VSAYPPNPENAPTVICERLTAIPETGLIPPKLPYVYPSQNWQRAEVWFYVRPYVHRLVRSGIEVTWRTRWKGSSWVIRRRVRAGMAYSDTVYGTHYLPTIKCSVHGRTVTLSLKADWPPHPAPGHPLPAPAVAAATQGAPGTPPEMSREPENRSIPTSRSIKFGPLGERWCAVCGQVVARWENWGEMGG
jgi:hypothetical protein